MERRLAHDHLVETAAETPDVDLLAVASLLVEHFWSQILSSAYQRVRQAIVFLLEYFTYAKIGQTYVAIFVYENVLRFEISVDHVPVVEILQCQDDLSSIEASFFLTKVAFLLDMVEEVATRNIFHDQEKMCWRLKCVIEIQDEGMLHFQENLTFVNCSLYESLGQDGRLLDDLHGVVLLFLSWLGEVFQANLGERIVQGIIAEEFIHFSSWWCESSVNKINFCVGTSSNDFTNSPVFKVNFVAKLLAGVLGIAIGLLGFLLNEFQ